jgi:vancomycin aglycone glucosyltransferase
VKILLAPFGSQGDVQPMIALGQRLEREGHAVLIAGSPDYAADAERRRLHYHAYGPSVAAFLANNAGDYAGGARRAHRVLNRIISLAIDHEFAALPSLACGFDLIVGAGVQIGAPSVAELLGIPYRYVVYCTALVKSPQVTPMLFPARSLPRWFIPLAWRMVRSGYNHSSLKQVNMHRATLGMGPVADIYPHVLTERPLLACDGVLWPATSDATPAPVQVGYLIPPDDRSLPRELEVFLERGDPPVYVGFGSTGEVDANATTRLIVEALRIAGRRGVILHGVGGLGHGLLPEGMIAVGDCDHTKLFPRTAVVVHHGGAGTTATASRAGVPQVVVSHLNEQYGWGRQTHRLGIGVRPIPRSKLTAARLGAAIRQAATIVSLAREAKAVAARLRETDPLENALRELVGSL